MTTREKRDGETRPDKDPLTESEKLNWSMDARDRKSQTQTEVSSLAGREQLSESICENVALKLWFLQAAHHRVGVRSLLQHGRVNWTNHLLSAL